MALDQRTPRRTLCRQKRLEGCDLRLMLTPEGFPLLFISGRFNRCGNRWGCPSGVENAHPLTRGVGSDILNRIRWKQLREENR